MKILIIEDNLELLSILSTVIPKAKTCTNLSDVPFDESFDLIICDRRLPDGDMLDYCHKFTNKNIPMIMISSLWSTEDVVKAIEQNINIYLTKPFSVDILEAYVNFFKRKNINILEYKNIKVDKNENKVYIDDEYIDLSNTEFKILEFLIKNKSNPIKRSDLLREIGKKDDSRAIDMCIARLRQKVKKIDIETVHGIGYKLVA